MSVLIAHIAYYVGTPADLMFDPALFRAALSVFGNAFNFDNLCTDDNK